MDLAFSGDNLYVVWEDNSLNGNHEILFKKSTDNGTTFGSTINLSNNTGSSFNPQISTTSNNVYVVWQDDSLSVNNTGNQDIFFKKNTDNGIPLAVTINLSNNTGDSISPQLKTSEKNGYIYVVWNDCSAQSDDPECDVFFKKGTDNVYYLWQYN